MSTELAYDYATTARILTAKGWAWDDVVIFLKKHQNHTGYILSSVIDKGE